MRRFLRDGENIEACVDGTIAPVTFKLEPQGDLPIQKILINIVGSGTFKPDVYGSNIALENGLRLGVFDAQNHTLVKDLLDGQPIKTNADWASFADDIGLVNFITESQCMRVVLDFQSPVYIPSGHYLGLIVQDDLTTLKSHTFLAVGP